MVNFYQKTRKTNRALRPYANKQDHTFASMYIWQIFSAWDIKLVHEMKLKNSSSQIT